MVNETPQVRMPSPPPPRPFRRAVLRGLAVLTPPMLTVLIILWVINTTSSYLLDPVMSWARQGLAWATADIRSDLPPPESGGWVYVDGLPYYRLANKSGIPKTVYEDVYKAHQQSGEPLPTTADGFYRRYVDLHYLRPVVAIPCFLAVFVVLLYLLGKFMAAGIGRFFGELFDRLMLHVPGVRAVYSAIKQVSDFLFTERTIRFTRIVAVEHPRRGIWSMGFMTGEGLASVHDSVGDALVTVLVPFSPWMMTGSTIVVRRSECIDLNITFDQACQYIVSCGVVVPPQQLQHVPTEAKS
jgi:uncharacterized membrane protein